jgi:hypothetical protein
MWSGLGLVGEAAPPIPANADPALNTLNTLAALYGEAPSRIVVSLAPDQWDTLATLAAERGVPLARLGEVGGDRLRFADALDVDVAALHAAWRGGLAAALNG